ncbi:MAG: hypothetical protein KatS3mg082_1443 [Nitrospiraceae bacterium]|nr:MAG: hypothetical protein KatS3mg082_1443 [Nitrospiraceae bacterium]
MAVAAAVAWASVVAGRAMAREEIEEAREVERGACCLQVGAEVQSSLHASEGRIDRLAVGLGARQRGIGDHLVFGANEDAVVNGGRLGHDLVPHRIQGLQACRDDGIRDLLVQRGIQRHDGFGGLGTQAVAGRIGGVGEQLAVYLGLDPGRRGGLAFVAVP